MKYKITVGERIKRGHKPHFGAGTIAAIANHLQRLGSIAMLKPRNVFFAISPNAQFQPFGQRIHNGYTNAVQAAGNLVGIAVKFTASVQLRHDHFSGRNAFFFVDTHRNTTAIIANRYAGIRVDCHGYRVGVTGQCFVDPVIHDLIHHMVQARAIIGITDIHARAFANRL